MSSTANKGIVSLESSSNKGIVSQINTEAMFIITDKTTNTEIDNETDNHQNDTSSQNQMKMNTNMLEILTRLRS